MSKEGDHRPAPAPNDSRGYLYLACFGCLPVAESSGINSCLQASSSTDGCISSPARAAWEVVVVDEPRKRGPPQAFIKG
jgi:hypothetical protein